MNTYTGIWYTPTNVSHWTQATLAFYIALRHSSFSFEVARNQDGYQYFEYRLTDSNGVTHSSGKLTSTSYSCGGLQENSTYTVSVLVSKSSSGPWSKMTRTFTTTSLTLWSWEQSNGYLSNLSGYASAEQTKKAYKAITTQGLLSDFSYLVWNDMVNKVYQIKFELDTVWDSTYASYESTKMSVWDKAVTSKRIRSLYINIGATIEKANAGDPIAGGIFEVATFWINYIISSIKQKS